MQRLSLIGGGVAAVAALAVITSPENTDPAIQPARTLEANIAVPGDVKGLLHRACYDCHSDETSWPWYSRVAPGSWLLHRDVTNGRRALNFSEWSGGAGTTPEKAAATLTAACVGMRTAEMPKRSYTWLHGEARLQSTEVTRFCSWADEEAKVLRHENSPVR